MANEKRESRFKTCLLFQNNTKVDTIMLPAKEVLFGAAENKHDKYDKY